MSIDQAGATATPKTSTASDNRVVKGKGHDAGKAPDVGFSSLLSTITAPVDPSVSEVDVSTSVLKKDNKLKEDASLLVSGTYPSVDPLGGEVGVTAPLEEQDKDLKDDVSLLVSAVSPRAELPVIENDAPTASLAKGKSLKDDASLLATAAPIRPVDESSSSRTLVGAGMATSEALIAVDSVAGRGVKFNGHAALQEDAPINPSAGAALVELIDPKLAQELLAQTHAKEGLDSKTQKLIQARQALGENLQTDVSKARLETRAVKAASELELSGKDAMQAKLSLVTDFAAHSIEPNERPRGKVSGLAGAFGAESGWTQYAHHARTNGDMPFSANPVMETQTQTQVADKVGYWVSQGIQNAELTLEGFGTDPVEVSILLKGGEAHVGFRTDQPEVRQMLEGAMNQLKDSLAREGVVLTGVTVGGSGAESGGGRQPEQRRDFGANRAGGLTQNPSESIAPRAPIAVGRSLDIFV